LSDDNALIYQRNFFLHTTKNRLLDPSEIRALDFKGEFRRFEISSVSATIDIDWSILANFLRRLPDQLAAKRPSASTQRLQLPRNPFSFRAASRVVRRNHHATR
jgi:hypothetical protein